MNFLPQLLNLDDVTTVENVHVSFAASWANQEPAWVVFGCVVLILGTTVLYRRSLKAGHRAARILLTTLRAITLCLLFLTLAEPVLLIRLISTPKPQLWFLVDGTESMSLADQYSPGDQAKLAKAVGLDQPVVTPRTPIENRKSEIENPSAPSRMDYVRSLFGQRNDGLVQRLAEKYRLRAFVVDRPDGVRALDWDADGGDPKSADASRLVSQFTTTGQVTALGAAFEDLALRHATGNLAGVVVVSDFDQNSGPSAIEAARKLAAPVFTLGVGAEAAVDVAVDLHTPLLLKRAERTNITITLRQNGLADRSAHVRLIARRLSGDGMGEAADETLVIGERTVRLTQSEHTVEFPFTPSLAGRFVLSAAVEPAEGELVEQNNVAEREVTVRDDFLRLMFVEYEPTWEWRFIKEVFHRDKLVGQRGFRTFLRSADPKVKEASDLFLSTLTPKRSEFFANDVIFLGDMPAETLSNRFCELTKEFVSKFGGGLVVIAGPRFGPSQLARTPLADLLPVVVDPTARLRDDKDFTLRLTPEADTVDFMQLGSGTERHADAENLRAWNNVGKLPWYQPVSRLHPLATALAVHPTDKTVDGKSSQPIIAIRRYGRGEVVYVGFDETWRLRRRYGELYYRQFWGQMIHRLGLSHALGSQKRFVVRTDRQQYQPDDQVHVTVEAYNANFEPLSPDDLPQKHLAAELHLPGQSGDDNERVQTLSIPQIRDGVFEAKFPALRSGEHRLSVTDPITSEKSDVHFQVTNVSLERRTAVRNVALQREIALATGGQSYDLETFHRFVDDFQPPRKAEQSVIVRPLWHTWLCFAVVVGLMLVEWFVRKLLNLR